MSFDVSTHPIYGSILRALGINPDTGEYSLVAADVSYIITQVPNECMNTDVNISEALKKLELEKFIKRDAGGDLSYYNLALEGRNYVRSLL